MNNLSFGDLPEKYRQAIIDGDPVLKAKETEAMEALERACRQVEMFMSIYGEDPKMRKRIEKSRRLIAGEITVDEFKEREL